MKRSSRIILAAAVVAAGCLLATGASAHGHWRGGPGVRFDFVVGPWGYWGWPYYPYYNYYPEYPAVVVTEPAPVYQQPSTSQMPAPVYYWYYCRQSNAYYPYVRDCPGAWEPVAPRPAETAPAVH
jgi:hypothetical protein